MARHSRAAWTPGASDPLRVGEATASTRDQLASPWPPAALGWSLTVLLALGYVVSFIDRYMITLLVEPIKHDLRLSDTQIGLLQGLAFGVVYAAAGLPIGWLVDRASRRWIVTAGIFGWTAMMVFSGLSRSFTALFIARSGVGIGEAALSPAGLSMISDHFPPEKRSRAISVFMLGASLGSGLSIIIGGSIVALVSRSGAVTIPLLGVLRPWQASFVLAGLPGVAVGVAMLGLREPTRKGVSFASDSPSGRAFVSFLKDRRGVLTLLIGGMSLYATAGYAFGAWVPTFFIRVFHWTPKDIALRYGPPLMLCSCIGMFGGGFCADRLTRRGVRGAPAILITLCAALSILPATCSTQLTDVNASLALILLFNLLGAGPFGLSVAALMLITPNQFRGKIASVYLCAISVVGYGVGPVAIGVLNDRVFSAHGAIKDSMSLLGAAVVPVAAVILGLSIRPFTRARAAASLWDPAVLAVRP